jgi:uncharacterized protein (TIGR03546 family)
VIKVVAKLAVALNSNVSKTQVAAGIAWGMLLGLVPPGNFFWIIVFLVSFFFTVHHGLKLACMALFILIAGICAPLIDTLGWEILHLEPLQPLLTTMYNMPFVPFTRFNNTLVAGGLAAGIALWLPLFVLMLPVIALYRNTLAPKIRKSKVFMTIAKFPLFALVDKAINKMGK